MATSIWLELRYAEYGFMVLQHNLAFFVYRHIRMKDLEEKCI